MLLSNTDLLIFFNELLQPEKIRDYCPNGLQVEGKPEIERIVCGVTASQALIDKAIEQKADAIFVHHGFFWKGEDPCIKGMKKNRFKALLEHEINLFAYHLPLDIHPVYGNNAQLASLLGITVDGGLEAGNAQSVPMRGHFESPKSIQQVSQLVESALGRKPLIEEGGPASISSVAWCTGGGQGYIEMAAEQGIDLYITGEVSEQTIHTAREMNLHFIAAGHHATERYGAKAIAGYLNETLPVEACFIDVDNPA